MKAQLTNPAQSETSGKERFRTGLIFGGIVVAIIVSIFLSQDDSGRAMVPSLMPHASVLVKETAHQTAQTVTESLSNVVKLLF